ncbi:farnesyl diphosphate synthase [Wenzhouxiangella sp. XN24]|uniref:farnesyl diphosphate synthase n=1 Tax=Wenzhouxiangella sp. XN24 TaxID=2713569 RepID=UPI003211D676
MKPEERLAASGVRVERCLERWLPVASAEPRRLHEAMRYAVLGGGKRVRPALVYFTGAALGLPETRLDGPAAAVELIHAYSLVHDDLPAMDDDDLRRGRPTCHRAYDEATAILVGDALQVLALEILAVDPEMVRNPAQRLEIIRLLARASGTAGMAGGQAVDLEAAGQTLPIAALERMHRLKTGALIHASVMMAAASADGLDASFTAALDTYGAAIGLAFQIQDDILDVEGDADVLGKRTQADAARAKPNYPSIVGLPEAKARLRELHDEALEALAVFGAEAEALRWLSGWLTERRH